MYPLTPYATQILSVLTIIGQLLLAAALVALIFFYERLKQRRFLNWFLKNSLILALVVAALATSGSLFYSEVAGFAPCKLCWFQRIFMYPQVILLAAALWLKDENIVYYSSWLAGFGLAIAAYHYLLQVNVAPVLSCSTVGYSAACRSQNHTP